MLIPIEGQKNLFRDSETNSIVNRNTDEYYNYIRQKTNYENDKIKIENLESDLKSLKSDMDEIKSLLRQLNESK